MRVKSIGRKIEPADFLFANNPGPMFVFDKNTYAFLDANEAAVAQYGYSREEFLSKTILDIRPEEDIPELLEYIRTDKIRDAYHVWRHRKRDGTTIYVRAQGRDITFDSHPAVLVSVQDVSDQVRLQERLRQSQKVEAIGRLAGGVAHDFNNLLTVISGNAAMLLEDITDPDLLLKVDDIHKAAARAGGLTRQLLSFSRKSLLQHKVLDPNTIVRNTSDMITRLIGEDIHVQIVLAPNVTSVRVDPVELEQVLMNLAVNARDAMPSGGKLRIATEAVCLKDGRTCTQLGLHPGRYVLLSVSDTGCGMNEEIKRHIFEPFFTTKPRGEGTGLGLSTVYGIVKQYGGSIDVESELGKGTVFRVYLPGAESVREAAALPEEQPKAGSETILVVEDEAVVREITSEGLKRRGYCVLSASDESMAEQICAASTSRIHLLLADVIMPGVNGPQLAKSLKALQPEMQVLFMSGYTDETLASCGFSSESVPLINKPFTFNQLHRKVRQILDATA
jgi:two-component system cell cycle sensor histidine kinase/response regulator CckA